MSLRALLAASLAIPLCPGAAPPAAAQCREHVEPDNPALPPYGQALAASRLDVGTGPTDWLAIGAENHRLSGTQLIVGAVYLFNRPAAGSAWTELPLVVPADAQPGSRFGAALCFGAGRLFVGRPDFDGAQVRAGAVVVLEHDGTAWVEVEQLESSTSVFQGRFGRALAWADGVLYVTQDISGTPGVGSVRAFESVAGQWTETAVIQPVGAPPYPLFARAAIAAEGGLLAVGAPGAATPTDNLGAAYLFERGPSGWTQLARLDPPTAAPGQHFGDTLTLAAGLMHVGAPGSASLGQPWAVHVYDVTAGAPQLLRTLDDPWPGGERGRVLAATSDTLLVGEWLPKAPQTSHENGAVHVFRPADASQPEVHRLVDGRYSSPANNSFGAAAAILGDTLVLSSTTFGSDILTGRIYSYEVPPIAEPFCHCEAGAPCGNEAHRTGCVGSRGGTSGVLEEGGFMVACGSASAGLDDLVLDAWGITAYQTAVLFSGTASHPPLPFADGLRCVGGETRRLGNATGTSPENRATFGPGLGALGGWQAGDTRSFQVWYRDPNGHCGNGSNLTHALRVTFQP